MGRRSIAHGPQHKASLILVHGAASVERMASSSRTAMSSRAGPASAARAPGSRATQPARPLIGDAPGGSVGQTVRTAGQLLMAAIPAYHFAYLEPQNWLLRRLVGT
jgi:hypothetical protein